MSTLIKPFTISFMGDAMIEFIDFVRRHGEPATQALIENIERFSGVESASACPSKNAGAMP